MGRSIALRICARRFHCCTPYLFNLACAGLLNWPLSNKARNESQNRNRLEKKLSELSAVPRRGTSRLPHSNVALLDVRGDSTTAATKEASGNGRNQASITRTTFRSFWPSMVGFRGEHGYRGFPWLSAGSNFEHSVVFVAGSAGELTRHHPISRSAENASVLARSSARA